MIDGFRSDLSRSFPTLSFYFIHFCSSKLKGSFFCFPYDLLLLVQFVKNSLEVLYLFLKVMVVFTSRKLASHADVLRLVTRSSPRTSAERSDHFRSLAVRLCFERTNRESVVIGMSG